MYSDRINGYIVTGSRGSSGCVMTHAGETVGTFTGPDSRLQATAAAEKLAPGVVPEPQPEPPAPKKTAFKPKPSKHKGAE